MKKYGRQLSVLERDRMRFEARRSYGQLTQRTTRGIFRRSTRTATTTTTGSGEARWA